MRARAVKFAAPISPLECVLRGAPFPYLLSTLNNSIRHRGLLVMQRQPTLYTAPKAKRDDSRPLCIPTGSRLCTTSGRPHLAGCVCELWSMVGATGDRASGGWQPLFESADAPLSFCLSRCLMPVKHTRGQTPSLYAKPPGPAAVGSCNTKAGEEHFL